jgi:hypothetical protein
MFRGTRTPASLRKKALIIIIIIIITEKRNKIYCSERSQAVAARPSAKSRLNARQSVGEMKQVQYGVQQCLGCVCDGEVAV